jgi:hypothetical protein
LLVNSVCKSQRKKRQALLNCSVRLSYALGFKRSAGLKFVKMYCQSCLTETAGSGHPTNNGPGSLEMALFAVEVQAMERKIHAG